MGRSVEEGMTSALLLLLMLSRFTACSMHPLGHLPVPALSLRGGTGVEEADVDPYDPVLYQQLDADAELEEERGEGEVQDAAAGITAVDNEQETIMVWREEMGD
eukprot:255477-Hanusia_phi.AAC.1